MKAPRTAAALIVRAPVRRATSAQNAGPSSPCSWISVRRDALADARDLLERRVDEHAGELDAAAQRGADRSGLAERAAARERRVEDHPDRPGAELGGEHRVLEARDTADLHARRVIARQRSARAAPAAPRAGSELGLGRVGRADGQRAVCPRTMPSARAPGRWARIASSSAGGAGDRAAVDRDDDVAAGADR